MALSRQRIHRGGETQYPWEREAIDYVEQKLDDRDPFHAYELQEFSDPSTGRLYDIDLLVIGYHAIYLIEIKSDPGVFRGNATDWQVHDPETGHQRYLANPYSLTNTKAKVLKSLIERQLRGAHRVAVEALIFLSHERARNSLEPYGNSRVVLRQDDDGDRGAGRSAGIIRAITHGTRLAEYQKQPRIRKPELRAYVAALDAIGLRPSRAARHIGQYELGRLFGEGEGYQEHHAGHRELSERRARVRSYLVPRATSTERAEQLRRAARREAQILTALGDHPGILSCIDYVADAPLGPALVFEDFADGVALDTFLGQHPTLSFDERLALIEQLADAIGFCHHKGVLHRNLEPRSVLVSRGPDQQLAVRLHRFFLAHGDDELGSHLGGTSHLTAFAGDDALLYQAPELYDNPAHATRASDIFSLGALAYLILTGQPPATDLEARDRALALDGGLDLQRVRDDYTAEVAEVVRCATHRLVTERYDDAREWLQLLLEEATAPVSKVEPLSRDAYFAEPGDALEGGYQVMQFLGSGGSARVLAVEGPDRGLYALKIPHKPENVDALRAEAEVLENLRHPHIVAGHGMHFVGGRECLLLDFAADTTLARQIRERGSINLDYARRYGDDLLGAVQHLEERGVQHRDIKSANIGFTPSDKQARHIILFDFSLSDIDSRAIAAGTAGYRDPFLRARGRWDAAADRWSAAVTLYEMLTGSVPELLEPTAAEPAGRPASQPTAADAASGRDPLGRRVYVDAERFDPVLRDRLRDFFATALAPDADQRFPSAEAMRYSWVALFEPVPTSAPAIAVPPARAPSPTRLAAPGAETATSTESVGQPETIDTVTGDTDTEDPWPRVLADLALDTPIDALPLSPRAKNALDRAGVTRCRELVVLPRNHLSAIRGIGTRVAREIQDAAEVLRQHFTGTEVSAGEPLAPGFVGRGVPLRPEGHVLQLSVDSYYQLRDAGIMTTAELAHTPRARIEHILGAGLADALRMALMAETRAPERYTLENWTHEFLSGRKRKLSKPEKQVRTYLGLTTLATATATTPAPALASTWWPSTAQVADMARVKRATVVSNLKKRTVHWLACPSLSALSLACAQALDPRARVAPLDTLIHDLVRAHGSHGTTSTGDTSGQEARRAAALVRMLVELHQRVLEVGGRPLAAASIAGHWFVATDPPEADDAPDDAAALLDAVRRLGQAADQLAQRAPLPSSESAYRSLRESVQGVTSLERLPPHRLAALAVSAAERAAVSARLEIYPRALPPERVLALSASILSVPEITPDELKKRVHSRYPEAQPLPERPALDALLPGFVYLDDQGVYRRRGHETASTSFTSIWSTPQLSARPDQRRRQTPEAREARAFDERVRTAVERGRFRVLLAPEDKAERAARILADKLGLERHSLDALVFAEMRALAEREDIALSALIDVDREGPEGPDWSGLCDIARDAADSVIAARLEARTRPQLLVHAGLLSRYRLDATLNTLVERAEYGDGAAIFLLVPTLGTGAAPSINHHLSIPAPLPGQRLDVPYSWLRNEHNAASEDTRT